MGELGTSWILSYEKRPPPGPLPSGSYPPFIVLLHSLLASGPFLTIESTFLRAPAHILPYPCVLVKPKRGWAVLFLLSYSAPRPKQHALTNLETWYIR